MKVFKKTLREHFSVFYVAPTITVRRNNKIIKDFFYTELKVLNCTICVKKRKTDLSI